MGVVFDEVTAEVTRDRRPQEGRGAEARDRREAEQPEGVVCACERKERRQRRLQAH